MGNIIAAIAVLGALGALFGLILSVASKIFEVKKDPREEAILSHLAGANCGGCAAAILAGNAPVTACAPAGPDNAAAIAEIMGMAAPTGERQVAFVRCNGGEAAKKRYQYVGVHDCISATKVAAGPLDCRFGCLGFGSCVNACQFGAMSILCLYCLRKASPKSLQLLTDSLFKSMYQSKDAPDKLSWKKYIHIFSSSVFAEIFL